MIAYSGAKEGDKVIQPQTSIPIAGRTQVLVSGGGTAGFAAAVAAARNGAKTMLLERTSCIGGMATGGLMGTFNFGNLLCGIFKEVIDRLQSRGAARVGIRGVSEGMAARVPYDIEQLKFLALEMLQESGVRLLLNTWVSDAIVHDGAIKGVVVENKSGRQAYMADVVVDCTGDADIAARAGVGYAIGRDKDNATQMATLVFSVGNIDVERVIEAMRENPTQFSGGKPRVDRLNKDIFGVAGFFDKLQAAKERGEVASTIDFLVPVFVPGCVEHRTLVILGTKIADFDPTNAEELTKAEIEGHRQIATLMNLMRREIPGFENAYLVETASQIGIRDSRRIVGEYIMSEEDIFEERIPEDTVALSCSQSPKIKGWNRYDRDNPELYQSARQELRWPLTITGIPYRSLLPKNLDQLLVAGRCISATWEAQGRSRSMPSCMAMGQAAGTAAALAATKNLSPKNLNIKELRERLSSEGLLVTWPVAIE
jgi:hypothetical protein